MIRFWPYAATLVGALIVADQILSLGIGPVWICLGAVLLLYLGIALAKYPAAFFAPLLFISRGMKLPATPLTREVGMTALPVGAILLLCALCFRLLHKASRRDTGWLADSFHGQGKAIAAFVFLAAVVAASYSYTPSPHYGGAKLVSFLTVGGLMFFAPFVLLRDENDFRHFAFATIALALVAGAATIHADAQGRFAQNEVVVHIGIGQIAGMAIVLLLYFKLFRSRHALLASIPCLLWLAAGLIATEVRGALLALVIVLLLSLFVRRRERTLLSPRAALVGFAFILAPLFFLPEHWIHGQAATMFRAKTVEMKQFIEHGSYSFKGSGGQRLIFFGAALKGIEQKPIFGWGVGGWAYYFWHTDAWKYPHNVFLEVAMEQGLVGLAAYLLLLGLAFQAAYKAFDAPGGQFAFVLPLLAYVVLLTCSTGDIDDCRFIWFTCALAFVAGRLIHAEEPQEALVSATCSR